MLSVTVVTKGNYQALLYFSAPLHLSTIQEAGTPRGRVSGHTTTALSLCVCAVVISLSGTFSTFLCSRRTMVSKAHGHSYRYNLLHGAVLRTKVLSTESSPSATTSDDMLALRHRRAIFLVRKANLATTEDVHSCAIGFGTLYSDFLIQED